MPELIRNIKHMSQVVSFEGMMRHRTITPTDIDGFIDYNGNAFIYIELKFNDSKLIGGQRMALENAVKSHIKAKHEAICFLVSHDVESKDIIIAKDHGVAEFYYFDEDREKLIWRKPSIKLNLLEAIDMIEKYWISKHINI